MRWWEQLKEKVNTYDEGHHFGRTHEINVDGINKAPIPWKDIEDSINQYYDRMQNKNDAKKQRELIKMRKEAVNDAYQKYVGFWGGEWLG